MSKSARRRRPTMKMRRTRKQTDNIQIPILLFRKPSVFGKKTERAWFSPKKILKKNNNFFLKSKEKDELRSSIQLIWKSRKKTKKD
jgi:hypothetical protein